MTSTIQYASTRDRHSSFSFTDAVLRGLAPDGGLFVPDHLPRLPEGVCARIMTAKSPDQPGVFLLEDLIPQFSANEIAEDLRDSLNFPIPLVPLSDNLWLLEVFHGPTLAFKDVGARSMARILSRIVRKMRREASILVATSGDTGSAVAHAFHGVPGIRVYVLYPGGLITPLQERQMTTLGDNIVALKVQGSFDDCQRMVKTLLEDKNLSEESGNILSTANSINIARLLPQMIYHSFGIAQLKNNFGKENPLMSIPSGNLGNLVSAVYAHARGLPVKHFIAATNENTAFPDFLESGHYEAHASKPTPSSAMDVGNPSNLERLQAFYHDRMGEMRSAITAIPISDKKTLETIRQVYQKHQYIADPHTAVGIAAAEVFRQKHPEYKNHPVIVTATAHPAKFPDVIRKALGENVKMETPERLQNISTKASHSLSIPADVKALRKLLLEESRARRAVPLQNIDKTDLP